MKALIFSYNKVPLEKNEKVEGTGLRYWRLALGLASLPKCSTIIAVLDKNKQIGEKDGVKVISFSEDIESIKKLINKEKPDVIIASYWMSGIGKRILDATPNNCFFIADAYSPFYVEFFVHSNSTAADKSIMQWYPAQLEECNYVLARADHVLVANNKQEELYRGVLSALGYDAYSEENRFIRVPGAVESYPSEAKSAKIDHSRKEILWFGGMYPWFDFSKLISLFSDPEISRIAYLRVVGGWNPVYSKTNVRYNGQYAHSYSLAKKMGLIGKSIYFEDWVYYDDRLNIFSSADWAISLNSSGPENAYSWRIRVADMAGNDVPILTNGGDPLGEWLIENKLAVRLDIEDDLKQNFIDVITDSKLSSDIKKKLNNAHKDTHIYSYTQNLVKIFEEEKPPRVSRPIGHVLDIYQSSQEHIKNISRKYNEIENNYLNAKNELEEARKYIDNLPKKISSVFPYVYSAIVRRIRTRLR